MAAVSGVVDSVAAKAAVTVTVPEMVAVSGVVTSDADKVPVTLT